jgi:hypothetical protein
MDKPNQVLIKALMLFNDVLQSSKHDYSMTFHSKILSFQIMHEETIRRAKNLETVAKAERTENKVLMERTTRALYEAIAFFEAYLNSFYSLLQIIAKITPLFYEKDGSVVPDDTFGKQREYLIRHSEIDPDFSSYLERSLAWYGILKNNRHAITHRRSAFLGFEKDGRIVFIDYPKNDFDWSDEKSTRDIENHLNQSFYDFFDFLDFYVKHYRKRVPESPRSKLILRSTSKKEEEEFLDKE